MPVALSYPGVYLEELPSGSRAIAGVATSVAAFVGRTRRGPVDAAISLKNFSDFERRFGGLWRESTMSYAVQQYFLNGGADARLVRVHHGAVAAGGGLPESGTLLFRATGASVTGDVVVAAGSTPDVVALTVPGLAGPIEVSADPTAANWLPTALAAASGAEVTLVGDIPGRLPKLGTYALAPPSSDALPEAKVPVAVPTIAFEAASAGAAGNAIKVTIGQGSGPDLFTIAAEAGGTAHGPAEVSIDAADASYVGTILAGAWPLRLSGSPPDVVPLPETFTLGGGSDAVTAAAAVAAFVDIAVGAQTLTLRSKTPGAGDNGLTVTIGAGGAADEFTIAVDGVPAETVSTDGSAGNFVDTVLGGGSWPIEVDGAVPAIPPAVGSYTLGEGSDAVSAAPAAKASKTVEIRTPVLKVSAADPGAWGNLLRVRVDHATRDPSDTKMFNLVIEELAAVGSSTVAQTETFRNLSVDPASPRFAETLVAQGSRLVNIDLVDATRPGVTDGAPVGLSGGSDGDAIDDNDMVRGLKALERADIFTLLCTPPPTFDTDVGGTVHDAALKLCQDRNAFYIVDAPGSWTSKDAAKAGATAGAPVARDDHAAVFFPRVMMPDALQEGRLREFVPCGAVAGVMARTDAKRGIWKAPAGIEATMLGVRGLSVELTDPEQGELNPIAVNCLRSFPVIGPVVWGARTWEGADVLASEWKYIPVRRLALFMKESLLRGSKWIVFEPNDEPLWAQIRLAFGGFMQNLFRQGAFQGASPKEAYFVKCDAETTTQTDRDLGIVNILVGFAPLKPAEFVVIKLQQIAGQAP